VFKIRLQNDLFTLVDKEDYIKFSLFHWWSDGLYAVREKRIGLRKLNKKQKIYLHREIVGAKKGEYTDHINRNSFDNRKFNLRICSQTENILNSKISKNNTSGFKGVYWFKPIKKWCAYITYHKKRKCLGYFEDIQKAVKARKQFERSIRV